MKKLIWLLGTLITSVMMGVGMIQPEEKVFTETSYYVGQQEDESPDWRGIYLNHVGGSAFSSVQASDKSVKKLGKDETTFVPKSDSRFVWFWSVNKKDVLDVKASNGGRYNDIKLTFDDESKTSMSLVESLAGDKLSSSTKMTFRLPKGTKLIAPANSYLVPASQNSDGAYPDDNQTKGKYIQFVIKKNNVAFKITYEDMLMWWTDMNKAKADDYKDGKDNQPLYYHSVAFSEKDMFDAGAIVGVAGNTGMTGDKRLEDTAYVTISIEQCEVKDGIVTNVWFPITIKQFYKVGGEQS